MSKEGPTPQVFLTFAARFPRIAVKYERMAYRAVLLNARCAMQTVYLTATAMGLAVCGIGNGEPQAFADATGLAMFEETSVAEIAVSGEIDPVLVHLALLSGLITVADRELAGALTEGHRLTVAQADRLRLATLRAFHQVCGDSGVSPYALDDLLWGLGRELWRPLAEFEAFVAKSPIVRGLKKPDKIPHFLDVLRGHVPEPAPFARIDRPLSPDTWYY